ncbi:KOW domain-containing RNA-binding protein [Clostridium oryzae]|uniref:50S ribosomal protein L14e n=1 Tax=Clostridium oryzae TaxID=1450648 RepID=A0A1V4ILE0_9CLOT|nr:KOW domain-containing RNA-binding protein [Clostridium oryzae]OPJ60650.1 50S ribosomal protein L14e [Clostridium oryzae]
MNLDNLIGRIVISKAGRDKGKYFIVVGAVDEYYVLIADGKLRPGSKPKKKKLRHLEITDIIANEIADSILCGNKLTDSMIRQYLKINVLQLNDRNKEV